jgi:hypothetical protein
MTVLPTDPSEHRQKQYYLKLVGNTKVQDWRWRFGAVDDPSAIAMSVEQLSVIGYCQWITGALLIRLEPEGSVLVPYQVYNFDVSQRVVVMNADRPSGDKT